MSNFKRDTKPSKTITSSGLSLQGSQINLSTRLSNFNISNPLHYLYNENVDALPSQGRPMSATTLGPTNQGSPRRLKHVKRPQSADTINKTTKNRHISFDFNEQQINTDSRNHVVLESTFDELDATELSSDGHSTPIQDNQQNENDGQPTLEPGLKSKPPIPPAGNVQQETFVPESKTSVTFDDAIELKFQRWFPNSAPIVTPITTDVSLNGMSYEYSERVIDNDKGTITYTRSSSSMSIRGSQDHLDEDNLYSNLSAAIGSGDKLKSSVSVDLLEIIQNDDNRRLSSVKLKKKKKTIPVIHKVKKDTSKTVLKSKPVVIKNEQIVVKNQPIGVVRNGQNLDKVKGDHTKKIVDSSVDYVKDDVVSWMSIHQRPSTPKLNSNIETFSKENQNTSTYDEIVNILKELESENDNIDMTVRKNGVSNNNKDQTLVPEPSSSSKALWSFLDEVEINSNRSTPSKLPQQKSLQKVSNTPPSSPETNVMDVKKRNFQKVMELGKAELTQQVAMLQLKLSEKEDVTAKLKITITELQAEHAKRKSEYESTITRHQKFIDKLLNEKKELSENCTLTVKEMTKKMNDALANQDERHKVELKKAVDKQVASEKIKKDRWVDLKTKKIKEMTIKGIEPELNRMSTAYQEELSELRRIHQSQIEEMEATWHRRMATMRDKMDAEREQAVVTERENSRYRLEMEISELEKSYQEQRKRLLGEIHGERLRQEKENEITLMDKQRALEQKFEKLVEELQKKINNKEQEFQNELKTIREMCESDKTKWIKHQAAVLTEKENTIKEICKKERDKHIELVIQKLENEATEREKTSETKIKRLKSEYEADIHELENTISGHRLKLNEARTKAQEYEDKIAELTTELNKYQVEQKRLNEMILKLKEELSSKENKKNETLAKVDILKSELNQSKLNFETKIKTIQHEKESELNCVYVRVKEAIRRKDETIQTLQSERNAALNQCSNMEILLEQQRKEILKLK